MSESDLSIFFWDCRLALDHAVALSKKYKVYHFVEWRSPYVRLEDYIVGYGFGVEKVSDLNYIEKSDVVMFTDVGYGGFADILRRRGKDCFGASHGGELLELDRVYMFELFKSIGIKTPDYKIVVGAENLKDAIPEDGNRYFVKLNIFRGNLETFSVLSKDAVDTYLDNADFGIFRDKMVFLVSKEVKGVEVGVDAFFNGREFLRPYLWGNEVKGAGFTAGKWVEESIWDEVLDKITPYLAETGYRGSISFEAIFDGSDLYVLDTTARLPYPGGSLIHFGLENYPEVVVAVARGEDIKPRPRYKYVVQLPLKRSDNKWIEVTGFDERYVFFPRYAVKVGDSVWLHPVKDDEDLGGVVCYGGDTLEEAQNGALKVGLNVQGISLDIKGILRYEDYIRELREFGVEW